ncbi:MAG: CaiB/BaiF CoA transferase family protein [Alphaproteobacteria bacterium]
MLPLSGFRVIAVEQYGAGPFGTSQLVNLGAEVIKIENPADGGDVGRLVGPHFFGSGDSHFDQSFNRDKRSFTLNLKAPEARAVFHDLVATADGVLDNLRGDLPAKLGVTYDALKDANPKIVCAHLSAYGRDGPRASWPGYDYLMQAETGALALTGEPDGPPARMGLSIVDLMTGLNAAFALLAGVIDARATGKGRDIDVCLFDTALNNLVYLATWYLNTGFNQGREPRSGHPSLTPSQLYRTGDGWIFIMCNKERFWGVLCESLGRPEWIDDPDFVDFAARLKNRARVTEMLDDALSARTTDDWLAHFAGKVPVAPVHDVKSALESDFVANSDRILELPHPTEGTIRVLAPSVRCPGEDVPRGLAPELGADTDDLLREIGYDADRIAALRAAKAI